MKRLTFLTVILVLSLSVFSQETGTFKDPRDGKVYKTVKIGNQWIMAENFAYKPRCGYYWAYKDEPSNIAKYGYLYDQATAKTIVPKGWHLPTDEEWRTLFKFLGDNPKDVYNKDVYKKIVVGGSSGFDALFGGWFKDEHVSLDEVTNEFKDFYRSKNETLDIIEAFDPKKAFLKKFNGIGSMAYFMNTKESLLFLDSLNEQAYISFGKCEGSSVRLFQDKQDTSATIANDAINSTFTDERDGKVYKTVTIGTQTWMAQNFAFKPNRGNYWVYNNLNNKRDVIAELGYLYDWETANNVATYEWRLPTNDDWAKLYNFLGGNEKEVYKKLIVGGNSGFNDRLCGMRLIDGSFNLLGRITNFWSEDKQWHFTINGIDSTSYFGFGQTNAIEGFSVRLIRYDLPKETLNKKLNSEVPTEDLKIIDNPTVIKNEDSFQKEDNLDMTNYTPKGDFKILDQDNITFVMSKVADQNVWTNYFFIELVNRSNKPIVRYQKLNALVGKNNCNNKQSKNVKVNILNGGIAEIIVPPGSCLVAIFNDKKDIKSQNFLFQPFADGSTDVNVNASVNFIAPDGKEYSSGKYKFYYNTFTSDH